MPQIDPKYVFWFGVWTNVLMLVATLGVDQAPPLVAQYAPTVQWVCGFFYKVNSVLLTAASGFSSNKTGPLVSVPVKAIIIVAFVIGALLMPSGAHAQAPLKLRPPAVTGNVGNDIKTDLGLNNAAPGQIAVPGQGGLLSPDALIKKIIALAAPDLAYAAAMATSANTSSSNVRLSCIKAVQTLNAQASGANLKNADGSLMAPPAEPHIFTDLETIAEGIDSLSPTGPLFTSCAGAAALAGMNVLAFINAMVTGVAATALVVPK